MVPKRMATKVAPSTSALPAGNCSRRKWSGRIPYLIGPNSAARMPNAEQCDIQQRERSLHISPRRQRGDKDFNEFQALGDQRLVVTVRQFAAERRKKKVRRDEYRACERDQDFGIARVQMEQNDKDQGGL